MADVRDGDVAGSDELRLRDVFPPVPASAWEAVVREDLRTSGGEARLIWHTDEGLDIKPFYCREDVGGLEGQMNSAPGEPPFVRGDTEPWLAVESPRWPDDAIRADLLHDAGATAVQELGWAIAEGVNRLAAATAGGTSIDEASQAVSFVFAVGSTYFIEIAKLRAARLLWATAVAAFGPANPASGAMRLHARTARANKSLSDPYTNLLRATTEAMSAAIGGADSLLVEPHGFEARLAINVQRILASEADLDAVADPAGGSYYIEAVTDALAREAWAIVQRVEAAGGHGAAVGAGDLASALDASRSARAQAIATRRRTLVGVNDYPDSSNVVPADGPFPVPEGEGPLAAYRLAAPFEALRARTARHADATGRRPVVHLLTGGDVKWRTARAAFAANLFGCAGFAISEGEHVPGVADLVVLCGSDADYPTLARAIVPAARVPVVVAGAPGAHADELNAAGVQGYVHTGIDAVRALSAWQDRLGMAP